MTEPSPRGEPAPPSELSLREIPNTATGAAANGGDLPASELKSSIAELIESLEPLLLEIRSDVDANRCKGESTAAALEHITGELVDMRAQLASISRTIVKSSKGFSDLRAELRRIRAAAIAAGRGASRRRGRASTSLVVGAGLVLISWAFLLYIKTGAPWPALAVVVGANLMGWLVLMTSPTRA